MTDERKALEEAFRAIWPEPHFITDGPANWDVWGARRDRFTAMLDAGAWLSAAEMLVPEGWQWGASNLAGAVRAPEAEWITKEAGSPALALLSAILAAMGVRAASEYSATAPSPIHGVF